MSPESEIMNKVKLAFSSFLQTIVKYTKDTEFERIRNENVVLKESNITLEEENMEQKAQIANLE